MAKNPPTSLILPAYVPNDELFELTERCLWSLGNTIDRGSCELVIVDNGSSEDVSMMLRYEADRYLHFNAPIGYARAANHGLANADHDWLCVINTDIEFTQKGWLERLQADYLETPGGILSADDEGREGIICDESWFSCWLTHRKIIEEVGYFDEMLPYRWHDQDYAIRVKQAGYEVMRDGNVQVKHIDSATYDTMGRDDSAEQTLLVGKWGADCFAQWLDLQGA